MTSRFAKRAFRRLTPTHQPNSIPGTQAVNETCVSPFPWCAVMHGTDRNLTIPTYSKPTYIERPGQAVDEPGDCARDGHPATGVTKFLPANFGPTRLCLKRFVLLLGLLCATPGCNFFYLAKRTMHYEPRDYDVTLEEAEACKQYAIWAEEAWSEWQGNNPGATASTDYYDGFRNGFVDYCFAGGSGEPPPIPPRRFWRTMYRNTAGDTAIADWTAGFRAGAGAARAGGYRKRAVVPSPASQYATAAVEVPQSPPTWQNNLPIPGAPAERLDDMFDAGELLQVGPELVAPGSGPGDSATQKPETPKPTTPKPETPQPAASDSGAPAAETTPSRTDIKVVPDPYLTSPIEEMQRDPKPQPPSKGQGAREIQAPANARTIDQVPELEPNRIRYEDLFRLPDERDLHHDNSATRLDFTPAGVQTSYTEVSTNGDEDADPDRAAWVLSSPPPGQPATSDQRAANQAAKANADELKDVENNEDSSGNPAPATLSLSDTVETTKLTPSAVVETDDSKANSSAEAGQKEPPRSSGQAQKSDDKKGSTKNATEWAKRAQSMFQDSADFPSTYTPYSNLYSEQP